MNASPKLLYTGAYEGDAFSKIHRYIAETGYNNDVTVLLATVTKSAPDLEIMLDADGRVLDKDFLVVARHLVKHKRIITLRKSSDKAFQTNIRLASKSVTETMTPAGEGPHIHDITDIEMADIQNDFTAEHVEIEYQDELREGDRVLVLESEEAMTWYIIDHAHFYE